MAAGAQPTPADKPNVLLVVMDCVRASDFPGGDHDGVSMPFVERLRQQSVMFPRAASVAPWTLPSHASMFTGLYPWEHGCHGKGSLVLDARFPCFASVLRDAGYRTLSISGNPIISPYYGLIHGFEMAHWGEWWEQVQRLKSSPSHSYDAEHEGRTPEVPVLSFRDRTGRIVKTMATRLPAALSLAEAIARRTLDPDDRTVGNINPWIEPTLDRWLTAQPVDRPVGCFVNLIDAHEPYLLDPTDAQSALDWWNHMRIPQDVLALLGTANLPSSDDLARLHDLYRKSIAVIDRRLERIVQSFRDAGRWENTLLILTSDHGQAFGEHGMIWHGVRTDEEMLRVPLLLRLPQDESARATGVGWASPLDVAATIRDVARIPTLAPGSGVSLRDLVASPRPIPLLAAGDGTEWNRPFIQALTPERRSQLNLFSVAAYVGSEKIVLDATSGQLRMFDLEPGGPKELPPKELDRPELRHVIEEAKLAAASLMHPPSAGTSSEVDERLRSWGYG